MQYRPMTYLKQDLQITLVSLMDYQSHNQPKLFENEQE